jgi:hypothetical protein
MQQKGPVNCQHFSKDSEDSWKCVQITDIKAPIGIIRVPPGTTFRKGRTLSGVDVVSLLEECCSQ